MATVQGRHLVIALICTVLCDIIFSQSPTASQNYNTSFKIDDNNNNNNNNNNSKSSAESSSSSSSKKISNSSSNMWITSTSNCTCQRELSALKRDLREEITQRMAIKSALDSYVAELSELKIAVFGNTSKPTLSHNAPAAPAAVTPSVAFSSKLSYNRELKPLDTVVFDTILTNDGNAYDPDTGKFTAVTPGTYFFHSTILSGYNTKVETAIIVNDKEIARIYSGAHDAHGSGSNMAIVNLRSGDSVWVRLLYQGGNHVHGYYSTFSGALLRSSEP